MKRLLLLYRSIIGKKVIAAVTGAVMMGFLILHVAGNLKAVLPDAAPGVPDIDVYASFLRTMGEPLLPYATLLWSVRIVLIASLLLHVTCVLQLARRNQRARPVRYREVRHVESTAPARWMLYSGSLLLAFLVIHLLQFTTGTIDAARFVPSGVYGNLYRAFHEWGYVAMYVGATVLLGLHLYHGAWSLFQSLGLDNPDRNRGLRQLAMVVALGLSLSFASVPVAFSLGALGPPPAESPKLALR